MSNKVKTIEDRALILEGGAMRGAFTAGALDCLIDNGVDFGYTIGVSAGSTNAINFVSRQRGRILYADTTLLKEHKYIGLKPLLSKGEFIDMDLLFGRFSTEIYPFDWETFHANKNRLEIVTTDCLTGEARYFERDASWDWSRVVDVAKASSSLPFINNRVWVDGREMLDGGLSDSVPLARAMSQGYKKALIILTQCPGFRKKQGTKLPKWLYRKFPRIIDLLNTRPERYNRDMDWIEELERTKGDDIIVIRPTPPLEVGRLTTDEKKVKRLYAQGYEAAKEIVHKL